MTGIRATIAVLPLIPSLFEICHWTENGNCSQCVIVCFLSWICFLKSCGSLAHQTAEICSMTQCTPCRASWITSCLLEHPRNTVSQLVKRVLDPFWILVLSFVPKSLAMGDSAEGGLSTKVFSLETICLVQLPCFQVRCSLICCDNGGPRLIDGCNCYEIEMYFSCAFAASCVCIEFASPNSGCGRGFTWSCSSAYMFFRSETWARVCWNIETHCARAYQLPLSPHEILCWVPSFWLQPKVAVHLYFDYRQWESERVLVLLNHFAD